MIFLKVSKFQKIKLAYYAILAQRFAPNLFYSMLALYPRSGYYSGASLEVRSVALLLTTFLRCRCQWLHFALQKYNKIFIYARKKSLFLLKIWSIEKKAVPLSPQTAISSLIQSIINRI